jgi:hypothetical protein
MSIESLTYADLGNRLGTSPEAARSLARRLRLPRKPGNDGKVRVTVDLAEIQYTPLPARSPGGQQADIDDRNARMEQLQTELARLQVEKSCLEASAACHRADFERERERCDTLMVEALTLTKVAMSAREKAGRLEGELAARRVRPWWRRFVAPDEVQARAVSGPSRPSSATVSAPAAGMGLPSPNGHGRLLPGVPVRNSLDRAERRSPPSPRSSHGVSSRPDRLGSSGCRDAAT